MVPLSLEELLKATGGKLLFGKPNTVHGVSIDTRTIGPRDFFVALKGERFDGHDFIGEALDKGAGAIVSLPPVSPPSSKAIVHVASTLKALQDLALYIRKKYSPRVLGITGTNGKTTTKEMVAQILSTGHKVLKNTGNLNNQIGLPLSLLELGPEHDAVVLEMGASAPGDIRELCEIAAPDIGVLTNIGLAHLVGFKDIESVRRTKLELIEGLGAVAVNSDDTFLMKGLSLYKGDVVTYGIERDPHVRASEIILGHRDTSFDLTTPAGRLPVRLRVTGLLNVYNALAASAAAYMFGATLEQTRLGLESFEGVHMRLELKEFKGGTVISDVYNANPASMEEAIKELLRLRQGRAIAVLGDMLDLGTYSETAHRKLGKWLAMMKVDLFIAVGDEMVAAAEEFASAGGGAVIRASEAEEAGQLLRGSFKQGDTVLIKGSRGMMMENVLVNGNGYANTVTREDQG